MTKRLVDHARPTRFVNKILFYCVINIVEDNNKVDTVLNSWNSNATKLTNLGAG